MKIMTMYDMLKILNNMPEIIPDRPEDATGYAWRKCFKCGSKQRGVHQCMRCGAVPRREMRG
jgi:hypothetical protein